MKKLLTVLLAVLMVLGLSACSNNSAADRNTDKENNQNETLSGKLSLSGSTSMEKVCEALAETLMEEYPDVTVTVEYTGSGAGIESVTSKMVDIGNSSRSLKDSEKEKGVVENVIAIDGIAVITNSSNAVENLSKEDLIKIYTGEIKNWKELGGKDENIVVLGREAGSGTRGAFEELLGIVDSCVYAGELDSTGGVKAKVASTEGTIGYVSLDVVDDTVKALKIDGVEATEANIKAGSYLLSRPFVMATNGEISAQNEIVQTWFDYIKSAKGQEVIKSVGLILPD
ncbi:MAG: phosphate ABC transporter substrate-binding protein [Erysipelotrichaceae bacterium]|nr:phosphate ABC transporter substrate-binding protein [Erysipelotrichaceae bacterium]